MNLLHSEEGVAELSCDWQWAVGLSLDDERDTDAKAERKIGSDRGGGEMFFKRDGLPFGFRGVEKRGSEFQRMKLATLQD